MHISRSDDVQHFLDVHLHLAAHARSGYLLHDNRGGCHVPWGCQYNRTRYRQWLGRNVSLRWVLTFTLINNWNNFSLMVDANSGELFSRMN